MKNSLPYNPIELQNSLKSQSPLVWEKRGQIQALKLFKAAASRIPAYKDFLNRHQITVEKVKTIADFKKIPTIDKDNYLRKYHLSQLCWDGKFNSNSWTLFTTSGSTGEPFYFPYKKTQYQQYALLAEMYLRDNFDIHKLSTLYVNAFPMGAWIGGVFTDNAIKMLADRGNYKLTIISPGIDKQGVINAIQKFGNEFDQVIIGSYGPFLKDILDDGVNQQVNWKQFNIKFIFSAEGFTESFRNYMYEIVGSKNVYKDSLNHYGTVDLGTMSHETPLSILIRRLAVQNQELYEKIFDQTTQLPTLTQYLPELFYFEAESGNLLCTANSGLPLVRYDLKDHGQVISFTDMQRFLEESDINISKEAIRTNIESTIWQLPFVHVFERSDFSVSFYAFFIYPQTIRKALLEKNLASFVSSKFSMSVQFNEQQNQYLEIQVELKKGVSESDKLENLVKQNIISQLKKDSSEYRETYKEKGPLVEPKIIFWRHEHPTYFKPGIKQAWVNKVQKTNVIRQPEKPIILKEGNYTAQDLNNIKKANIWKTNDIYEKQLAEVFEVNHPELLFSKKFKTAQEKFITKKSTNQLSGNWIYFPWNGELIHSVNEEEYYTLRTNRNKNIITREEQEVLKDTCVGIFGLSVGSNIAIDLHYQGISQCMKLAEYDTLETTNLNRVKSGIHKIGIKKSEIAAHAIYEVNPYANLYFFEKINNESLNIFFDQSPQPNIVFDEIDDFKMKVLLRLKAKSSRIPVIMLTNLGDSTMIDIERYDIDQDLEIFNGLLGDLTNDILDNTDMSPEDIKKYAIRIVGPENVPQRAIESVKQIGKTLVGRPQLSSTVTICGGIGTYLVRELILCNSLNSGRHIFKYNSLIK